MQAARALGIDRNRLLLSLLAAETVSLSILHHRFNFWGWLLQRQALTVLLLAPCAALLLERLLRPIWPALLRIPLKRWLVFLLPAALIAGIVARVWLVLPEVPHRLEITFSGGSAPVRLAELRAAYGNAVPFAVLGVNAGWSVEQHLLVSTGPRPAPIRYSFVGPINEQVRVTFLASPHGGQAQAFLDGRRAAVNLDGPDGDERRARIATSYRWGALNFLVVPLIWIADALSVLLILVAFWLMQELTQVANAESSVPERFLSHVQGLALVCTAALALHAITFAATPLNIYEDSSSYLQGAMHWMAYGNLDGVSSYRGLGTTLLFTPAIALFGRSPYGLKTLLHVLAIACIPISYRLGWQLGRRRWFAFSVALLSILIPDMYMHASGVGSEIPHVFSVLLFCTFLMSALAELSLGWVFATLLAGAFSVLVRSENLLVLLLGTAALIARAVEMRTRRPPMVQGSPPAWQYGLVMLLAAVPLLAWSLHNQRVNGFFGLSDYGGEILYDGWVYFGENSPIPITDRDSPAVLAIESVHPVGPSEEGAAATGWTIYNALISNGYSTEQSFSLLQAAAVDSILKDPARSWRLLWFKLEQGFEPQPLIVGTFLLPGERYTGKPPFNLDYFDPEQISLPALVGLQRAANEMVFRSYRSVFSAWLWAGLTMLFICLYRRPLLPWAALGTIALDGLLFGNIVGMSMWRYTLVAIVLIPVLLVAGFQSLYRFGVCYRAALQAMQPAG